MGRIFKANQVKLSDKPLFVYHEPEKEKPKPVIDPCEEAFDEEAFQVLSHERLSQNQPEIQQSNRESMLSPEARKSRHAAVLESLRIKELELEALEEELKSWENDLKQKENELIQKEQDQIQDFITRRQETDTECQQSLHLAKEAAASIHSAAKAESEAIKKTAQAEADSIREKARKEGYDAGELKGRSQGEQEGLHEIKLDWNNLMNESEALINELQTSRMGILRSSEEEMLKLVISFAKAVLKVEPLVQPEIILKNIESALSKITEADKIVMKINMRDKSMCQDHKDMFMARLASVNELKIVEDPNLAPGGIKIETGINTIDATIQTQAKSLELALLEKYRKSQAVA